MSKESRLAFFNLVKEMRNAQKNYYSTRDKQWLHKSLELEKRVDAEILRGDTYLAQQSQQPNIFQQ